MENLKITVGVLFGGKSAEHEISIQSARNIVEALDPNRYEVVLLHIDKRGTWHLLDNPTLLNGVPIGQSLLPEQLGEPVWMAPESRGALSPSGRPSKDQKLDVVFPILHGPFGEDGTVQGMLKLAHIPYVGVDVLGSAVGMDKDVMKRLLRDAGLPIGAYLPFRKTDPRPTFQHVSDQLGIPVFVKPANLGSSVGISRVDTAEEFETALDLAFSFDHKIVVEAFINGREIECGVLGNAFPEASFPGEIIPTHRFYSYEAKYLDEKGAQVEIPARITAEQTELIRKMAVEVFKTLQCEGLSRVDFFLTGEGQIYVNEINTMPGFTQISMFPKMWEYTGLSYPQLIDRLIQLAVERFERDDRLRTSY